MSIRIALAGNPNSGKTTLFNALTGSNQYVGNWPGVTVEKKEGKLKWNKEVVIADLPGIYSLSPYTLEEVVARNYLLGDRPDAIINIVDGTNLERNLYLTTQILELGIPVVIAINMIDLVEKEGDTINLNGLSEKLGCQVVAISALKGTGIEEAANLAAALAEEKQGFAVAHKYSEQVEAALATIEAAVKGSAPAGEERFCAVKLFERDSKIAESLKSVPDVEATIAAVEAALDDDAESIITNERYGYIEGIIKEDYVKKNKGKLSVSDKIDQIVTNRILGLPIFALVIFIVYYVSMSTLGAFLTDWVNEAVFEEAIIPMAADFFESIECADWLSGLIVDGIISGVGAVLGFVPQMLVLFLFLAFLESCGYMSRVAFVMDRIFRKFGLSGKSFIPMLVATGCGVPAVMSSRTIEQDRDRKMTIITTTFMPCGAKIPILGLIAGAVFDGAAWVATAAYFIGVAAIIVSGIMLKKTKVFSGDPAPFVMELPSYHMPTVGTVLRSTWERGWSFIKKAGTIILLSTILVWFLSSFSVDGGFHMLEDELEQDTSILANVASLISWIFVPLGFGSWKAVAAAVTGLIAKENVVGTFGILYGFAEVAEEGDEIWGLLAADFTAAAAFSFMVFNLLCAPCFAAMGAIKREMNNVKWFWIAIGYQCVFAYLVSLCVYQFWTVFTGGAIGIGTIAAVIVLVAMLYMLFRPDPSNKLKAQSKESASRA